MGKEQPLLFPISGNSLSPSPEKNAPQKKSRKRVHSSSTHTASHSTQQSSCEKKRKVSPAKVILRFQPYSESSGVIMDQNGYKRQFELVVSRTQPLSHVFGHLLKKWSAVVSHSNELSLYPARDHPLAIYEHVLRPLHGREGDHSHSVRVGELGSGLSRLPRHLVHEQSGVGVSAGISVFPGQ
ncbi:hypothetical protein WA588_004247 [Blastocystis sp. NMH]